MQNILKQENNIIIVQDKYGYFNVLTVDGLP